MSQQERAGDQQGDLSPGTNQTGNSSSLNIYASQMHNYIDMRNSMDQSRLPQSVAPSTFDGQALKEHLRGLKGPPGFPLGQQPCANQFDGYYPAGDRAPAERRYGNANFGVGPLPLNRPNNWQANRGNLWPHNGPYMGADGHQSLTMGHTFLGQHQGGVKGPQHIKEYLIQGCGQENQQSYGLPSTSSLSRQNTARRAGCRPIAPKQSPQQTQSTYLSQSAQPTYPPLQANPLRLQPALSHLSPDQLLVQQAQPPTQPLANTTPRLQFANREQAHARKHARNLGWQPPSNDRTIPQTDAQRALYVQRLMSGILDISHTKETSKPFQNRWKSKIAIGKLHYEIDDVETVCWDLIYITERLHRQGPSTLSIFDKTSLGHVEKSRGSTFAQRVNAMIGLARETKASVDSLMRGEKLEMFVACAQHKFKECLQNRVGNGKKKEMIQRGRKNSKNNEEQEVPVEDPAAPAEPTAARREQDYWAPKQAVIKDEGINNIPYAYNESAHLALPKQTDDLSPQTEHTKATPHFVPNQLPALMNDGVPTGATFSEDQEDSKPTSLLGYVAPGFQATQAPTSGSHVGATAPLPIQSLKRSVDRAQLDDQNIESAKRARNPAMPRPWVAAASGV
ncbi:hypothetical protein EJ02DRAFT_426604 [Clathrospora elynae]|uniref:Uncharacterized protein n=1 Tax=Clathrospora elynae TaxID=706981 RepID=A0A6A5SCX7_9PLEO|nr:hypothetical protein EJ02DRAFT_426604 [Clathrospora elynae]